MTDVTPRAAGFGPTRRTWLLALVVLVAALLHAWAVVLLPVDFDEPIYVSAALDYADLLRAGDFAGVVNYPGNREHPALVKLIYAGGALALGERADTTTTLYTARAISAFFGVLAVATMGWFFGPLAGGLLAIHTLAVKYTSQAYLEALPLWLIILTFGLLTRRQSTVHSPQSTVHSPQSTVHSPQFTVPGHSSLLSPSAPLPLPNLPTRSSPCRPWRIC